MSTSNNSQAGVESPAAGAGEPRTVPVWDPVVRIFHWSLVAAVLAAWASAEEARTLHETIGFVILGLLALRIVWGFVGTRHARFADFVHRPSSVASYLVDMGRHRARRYLGHNPAGGAMIVMLLVAFAATCASGVLMLAGVGLGHRQWEDVHEIIVNMTLVLAGIHIAGVVVASLLHRENLIGAMISGRKRPM